jgi:hypothetical protein
MFSSWKFEMPVEMRAGRGGEVLYLLREPPSVLPLVSKRDLEQAWEAAGCVTALGPARVFCFKLPDAPPLELRVADRDASAWVAAVEQSIGLGTARGVSVCLRLLALVALMAQAGWARDWFAVSRAGARIRPELLHAAAMVRLNATGGFDETALRALLPGEMARGAAR